jgi:hypothetical protein
VEYGPDRLDDLFQRSHGAHPGATGSAGEVREQDSNGGLHLLACILFGPDLLSPIATSLTGLDIAIRASVGERELYRSIAGCHGGSEVLVLWLC